MMELMSLRHSRALRDSSPQSAAGHLRQEDRAAHQSRHDACEPSARGVRREVRVAASGAESYYIQECNYNERNGVTIRFLGGIEQSSRFSDAEGQAPDCLAAVEDRREFRRASGRSFALPFVVAAVFGSRRARQRHVEIWATSESCGLSGALDGMTPTNGATDDPAGRRFHSRRTRRLRRPVDGGMPTSSCASRSAVSSRVASTGSTRPPGNATCPR